MADQTIAPSFAPYGKSPTQSWPVILETKGWKDYRLLDMGDGEKLERYGRFTIVRPEPQAMGTRRQPESVWNRANAVFSGEV